MYESLASAAGVGQFVQPVVAHGGQSIMSSAEGSGTNVGLTTGDIHDSVAIAQFVVQIFVGQRPGDSLPSGIDHEELLPSVLCELRKLLEEHRLDPREAAEKIRAYIPPEKSELAKLQADLLAFLGNAGTAPPPQAQSRRWALKAGMLVIALSVLGLGVSQVSNRRSPQAAVQEKPDTDLQVEPKDNSEQVDWALAPPAQVPPAGSEKTVSGGTDGRTPDTQSLRSVGSGIIVSAHSTVAAAMNVASADPKLALSMCDKSDAAELSRLICRALAISKSKEPDASQRAGEVFTAVAKNLANPDSRAAAAWRMFYLAETEESSRTALRAASEREDATAEELVLAAGVSENPVEMRDLLDRGVALCERKGCSTGIHAYALATRGWAKGQQGDLSGAAVDLRGGLARRAQDGRTPSPEWVTALVEVLSRQEGKAATPEVERLVRDARAGMEPDQSVSVEIAFVSHLERTRERGRAVEEVNRLASVRPADRAVAAMAALVVANQYGDWSTANTQLDALIEQDEKDPYLIDAKSTALYRLGKAGDARAMLERARSRGVQLTDHSAAIGCTLSSDWSAAVGFCDQVKATTANETETIALVGKFYLLRTGNPTHGLSILARGLRLSEEDESASEAYCVALSQKSDLASGLLNTCIERSNRFPENDALNAAAGLMLSTSDRAAGIKRLDDFWRSGKRWQRSQTGQQLVNQLLARAPIRGEAVARILDELKVECSECSTWVEWSRAELAKLTNGWKSALPLVEKLATRKDADANFLLLAAEYAFAAGDEESVNRFLKRATDLGFDFLTPSTITSAEGRASYLEIYNSHAKDTAVTTAYANSLLDLEVTTREGFLEIDEKLAGLDFSSDPKPWLGEWLRARLAFRALSVLSAQDVSGSDAKWCLEHLQKRAEALAAQGHQSYADYWMSWGVLDERLRRGLADGTTLRDMEFFARRSVKGDPGFYGGYEALELVLGHQKRPLSDLIAPLEEAARRNPMDLRIAELLTRSLTSGSPKSEAALKAAEVAHSLGSKDGTVGALLISDRYHSGRASDFELLLPLEIDRQIVAKKLFNDGERDVAQRLFLTISRFGGASATDDELTFAVTLVDANSDKSRDPLISKDDSPAQQGSRNASNERALEIVESVYRRDTNVLSLPSHAWRANLRGELLRRLGRPKEAEGWHRKAVELDPDYRLGWWHLFVAVLRQDGGSARCNEFPTLIQKGAVPLQSVVAEFEIFLDNDCGRDDAEKLATAIGDLFANEIATLDDTERVKILKPFLHIDPIAVLALADTVLQ